MDHIDLKVMELNGGNIFYLQVSIQDRIYPGDLLQYCPEDHLFHKLTYSENGELNIIVTHPIVRAMENYTPNHTAEFIAKIWYVLFPRLDYEKLKLYWDERELDVKTKNGMEILL